MNQTILIAEDSLTDFLYLKAVLEKTFPNYKVEHTTTGKETMDFLRMQGRYKDRPAGHPDLLMLDLYMPEMDGFEVMEHMAEDGFLEDIPIHIITNSEMTDDHSRTLDLGAQSYIQKPVTSEKLLKALEKDLERERKKAPVALA